MAEVLARIVLLLASAIALGFALAMFVASGVTHGFYGSETATAAQRLGVAMLLAVAVSVLTARKE